VSANGIGDLSWEIDISSANAQIPRRVRLDSATVKALNVGLLMLLFGAVVLFWVSYCTIKNLHALYVLHGEGHMLNGDITEESVNRGGEYVRYRFSVDGVLYSGQSEMEADGHSSRSDSKKIPILYLPENPHVNLPINWRPISVWDLFPYLLLFSITALGAYVTIISLRQWKLMRMGVVAIGKVTGCAQNKKLFTVYYQFAEEDNATSEGSSNVLDEYGVGALIPIIYLRTNPKRNDRYPVAGFRIAD
jgi:hypothetical protein